ncbi:hypothetical protein HZA99_02430 [Candidatus Woesearchaeota archaeon]|nr:hypothetical protein [Candidatus Woesearchaeota archaeon]
MESMEYNLLRDFQKNKNEFLKESKEVTEYMERGFARIFQHVKDARKLLNEILEYLQEFKAEELENDFNKLNENLYAIRKLISLIQEYVRYLERKSKEKRFLDVKDQEYDPVFLKKCEKYNFLKAAIDHTMREVLEAETYVPEYHEEIKYTESYKGCRHARIKENLRLFYFYNKKSNILRWIDIITKNEFDKTK